MSETVCHVEAVCLLSSQCFSCCFPLPVSFCLCCLSLCVCVLLGVASKVPLTCLICSTHVPQLLHYKRPDCSPSLSQILLSLMWETLPAMSVAAVQLHLLDFWQPTLAYSPGHSPWCYNKLLNWFGSWLLIKSVIVQPTTHQRVFYQGTRCKRLCWLQCFFTFHFAFCLFAFFLFVMYNVCILLCDIVSRHQICLCLRHETVE